MSSELTAFLESRRKAEAAEKQQAAEKKEKERALKERRKKLREVQKTTKLMKLGDTITDLIAQLQDYSKDLVKGTATKKQVGKLYFTMSSLATQNRKMKGSFKDA